MKLNRENFIKYCIYIALACFGYALCKDVLKIEEFTPAYFLACACLYEVLALRSDMTPEDDDA